ncbi:MAG: DNA methyltransferase [Dysgonomonas sp.]|nr:DNA methyltransferase [Dysgonomonas sp.]
MKLERNKSYKGDCVELMKLLPNESVNVILTDPPYLYLKNQKLDRPFDETEYFNQVKRVLKKDGFIVLFGRGTSFYRWNTILADLGFNFKEEIIWDKKRTSSPLLNLGRCHETISIHSKGNGTINKVRVPYLESTIDIERISSDIKRITPILSNPKELADVEYYLQTGELPNRYDRSELSASVSSNISTPSPCVNTVKVIQEGKIEKSIITTIVECCTPRTKGIHPTQKPPRLLERLLALVCKGEPNKPKLLILDTFRGSGSTDIACMNFGVDYISFEIDDEYFDRANIRIDKYKKAIFEKKYN